MRAPATRPNASTMAMPAIRCSAVNNPGNAICDQPYRAVHWMDYTARTAGPIFSLAPRRKSGERVGVRGCHLSPILRTPP
jgi:hypothetical protein